MQDRKHLRLAREASRLKKAWLFAIAFAGYGQRVVQKDLVVANYVLWENKALKREIVELKNDVDQVAGRLLLEWKTNHFPDFASWCEERFNEWEAAGFGLYDAGRLHEIESAIGRLKIHQSMDCPPYAQVLIQGLQDSALRHPEYHLARDLALLYNLFLDAEKILGALIQRKKVCSSEHSQSLARSVILTCYNLLESFVSGISAEFRVTNPTASAEVVKQLEGKRPKGGDVPLWEKFVTFPALITGRPPLDRNAPNLKELFGPCKHRRDSFVHCEPGPALTKRGYVKEEYFHDVDAMTVRKTVDLTIEAICQAWHMIHGRERPSWLPRKLPSGRFEKVEVELRPIELA